MPPCLHARAEEGIRPPAHHPLKPPPEVAHGRAAELGTRKLAASGPRRCRVHPVGATATAGQALRHIEPSSTRALGPTPRWRPAGVTSLVTPRDRLRTRAKPTHGQVGSRWVSSADAGGVFVGRRRRPPPQLGDRFVALLESEPKAPLLPSLLTQPATPERAEPTEEPVADGPGPGVSRRGRAPGPRCRPGCRGGGARAWRPRRRRPA